MLVCGATGEFSSKINGTYLRLAESLNGYPAYGKEGDPDSFLFRRTDGKWAAGATAKEKEENNKYAGFAFSMETGLAHTSLAANWEVFDGKWETQQVTASTLVSSHHSCITIMMQLN